MAKIGVVLAVIVAAITGLVMWNKHKIAARNAEYEDSMRLAQDARRAVVDRHRAEADKQIATIEKAMADAKASPQVTARMPLAAPLAARPTLTKLEYAATGDTVVVGVAEPEGLKVPLLRGFQPMASRFIGSEAGGKYDTTPPDQVEAAFKQLAALKYALLLRVHEVTTPSASADKRFTAGSAQGDGQLYDLATGKRVGAYPFSVRQRDQASVHGSSDVDGQLLKSFTYDVATAAESELTAFLDNKAGRSPASADAESLERFARKLSLELGLSYVGAGIKSIVVTHGDDRPIVTFTAQMPKVLMPGGKVPDDLAATVKKVLGVTAEIRAVAATP